MAIRWIITSICSVIFFTLLASVGHFHTYYAKREKEYNRAMIFIKSETCTNPRVRSQLGDFNLCDISETILAKTPMQAAFYDLAEEWQIAYSKNLWKWVFGAIAVSFVGVWIGIIDFKDAWNMSVQNHYTLPIKMKNT